jgi:DNA polymerase-3 subunit epsilon
LCLSALGLEKTLNGKPCFAYQLKKCRGACVGKETPDEHAIRLRMAMVSIKINTWPYEGAIGIQEATDLHIIDNWCYLGTAKSKADIKEILSAGKPLFDRDNYVMLSKALQNKPVIKLDRHVSEHN